MNKTRFALSALLASVFTLPCSSLLNGQEVFPIRDATLGLSENFRIDRYYKPEWRDANRLTFWHKNSLVEYGPKGSMITILNAAQLSEWLEKEVKTVPTAYHWLGSDSLYIESGRVRITLSFSQKKSIASQEIPEKAEDLNFCKKNGYTAARIENNVFIIPPAGAPIQITFFEDKQIVAGAAYTSRQEFGIQQGTFWSPKGTFLAFYVKDESKVEDYPLVETHTRSARLNMIKYPMAGETSETLSMQVLDINTRSIVTIPAPKREEDYMTSVTWSPNEEYLYVGLLNRRQDTLNMYRFNSKERWKPELLFQETSATYVEPEAPLHFLPNSNAFIWESERDGHNHLYLYAADGKSFMQLTTGDFSVTNFIGISPDGKVAFVQTTRPGALYREIGMINLKNTRYTPLLTGQYWYNAVMSPSGNRLFWERSSLTEPYTCGMADQKGAQSIRYTATNPFVEKGITLPKMEMVTLVAADGKTPLHGRIIYPADYNTNKKYPAIVYVYGGPHAQLVTGRFLGGASLWDYYMASKGYIMFTLDNRGSANRGQAFESVIHKQLGTAESDDQMKGVEFLLNLGTVDPERIGVHGWSYGGFMTLTMLTKFPDTFKAGVAGGPVIDWKWYEVMYGERYMGTPQNNPEGYQNSSLLGKVNKLKASTLIIHGAQDDVVVMQHALEFLEACIKAGVQLDFFTYPSHQHNVRGIDRVHLMQKITEFFDKNLQ